MPNFSFLDWLSFSSTVISCLQLSTAVDSWYEKNLTGIHMYTLKLILGPNFSSLAWFSFSSAVNSCNQLLTADDSCYEKKSNGIFIYPLKLIPVPNFSSGGCLGAWLESDGSRRTASGSRRTPGKTKPTQAQLSWCLCLSWAIKLECLNLENYINFKV